MWFGAYHDLDATHSRSCDLQTPIHVVLLNNPSAMRNPYKSNDRFRAKLCFVLWLQQERYNKTRYKEFYETLTRARLKELNDGSTRTRYSED